VGLALADETLDHSDLIGERTGICPAPGHWPARNRHSAKLDMFALLGAGDIGMS
jgi:cobalamin-dependent methionine synthase I